MNKTMVKAALAGFAFIVALPLGLRAQDEGYYPYSYARLSYVNGSVYVQRTSDLGYEKGEVNLALVQGDKIGTESGRAEIQLGRRNYLRLGDNTQVEFAALPQAGDERVSLHLTAGSVYVRVNALPVEKGVEIHTPDASFYVLEEGLYRFDVRPEGASQVFVREGSLEAAAEEGSKLVQTGGALSASNGRLLGDAEYGYAPADAFDDWNGSRDELLAARSGRQYLPSDMEEYEEELDQNGRWVYERPYGNVWVPNVSYYDDWRPYYYGRWAWYPVIGWTWISSETWGWPVYHYGRWNWRFGLGWYWIPRSHWGPAWVHWWWDRDYIGWCPLTWYNRPGYLLNDRFYDRYDDRWFSARNRAMTVVRRDRLQDPDIGRRHLGAADLDRIGRVELRAQQPGIRPRVDNARPQAIAARRALSDPRGGRAQVRELTPSRAVSSSRLRPGSAGQGLRLRDGSTRPAASRDAVSRPAIRGESDAGRAIRSYPGGRVAGSREQGAVAGDRGSAGIYPSRRGPGDAGQASGSRATGSRASRSQTQEWGSSRGAAVNEQPSRTSGSDRGAAAPRREGSVRRYSSTVGPARSGGSSTASSRSGLSRSSSRPSRPSVSSARPSPSISRPSPSGRSTAPSSSSPGLSSRSRSSSGSVSRSRSSYAQPSRSGSSGRSFAAPRPSGSSAARSLGASRSSRASSGRSFSSPRSSGSSGRSSVRSSGSARSGGRSSSGRGSSSRSSSSSSRSSSKSSGARRR